MLRSDHLPPNEILSEKYFEFQKSITGLLKFHLFALLSNTFKGIKNTLADTMSRLIDINPQTQQDSEPEGFEFGYYTFDTLPALEVSNIETTQDASSNDKRDFNENLY